MTKIRTAVEADALRLIQLRKKLFTETNFMLFEPDEFNPSEVEGREFISMFINAGNSNIFIAVNERSEFIGFMGVAGGNTNRTKHMSHLFMGVLKKYWGQGVAKQLFFSMFAWSKINNIVRLELTTAVDNERAYGLYLAMGFEVEGILKNNICVDGVYTDEYQMSVIQL